eukprot:TRINITY_DN10044_c0_g1_i1.p1 TRINITY_DN10044_c0_g1~~TRINITY_DN10044_c0_g1_i1.p1  ORF type:complete len:206 (+),score=33.36 TRINITY_DN10044_c0_g1_i1:75-692(+)
MSVNITETVNIVISNINTSVGTNVTNPHILIKYVSMLFGVDTSKIEDKLFVVNHEDKKLLDEYDVEFGPHIVYNTDNNTFYYLYSILDGTIKDTSIIVKVNGHYFRILYEGIPPSYGYKLNIILIEDIFNIVGKQDILNSYGKYDKITKDIYFDIFTSQSCMMIDSTLEVKQYCYVLPNLTENYILKNVDEIVKALGSLQDKDEN